MSDDLAKTITAELEQQGIKSEQPVEEASEAAPAESERTYTDFEKEQMEKGWNPNGPKSAEEWERHEGLYAEIKKRGKQIKTLSRTIDELREHMTKQEQRAYERALAELTREKHKASRAGDFELVEALEKEQQNLKPVEMVAPLPPAVSDFLERNATWLNGVSYEEMQMSEWTKKRDVELAQKGLDPDKHMALLEEHVHKQFPDYFGHKEARPGLAVESGRSDASSTTKSTPKKTFHDLNDTQKQICRDFERMGVMTKDQYISQLVELGELNEKRQR